MESTPLVSIIVPVYNVEKYIDRCVESVVSQTFTDWELLLIDDGSPDKSGELCDVWSKHDSRIKVFHKKNGGVSSARNLGIKEAKGKYITFIDSDDWVTPTYLEDFNLETVANTDIEDCILISQGIRMIFPEKKYTSNMFIYENIEINIKENPKFLIDYNILANGCPVAKIFDSKIIKQYNLSFNEGISLNEDHLFILDYLYYTSKIFLKHPANYSYFYDFKVPSLTKIKHSSQDSINAGIALYESFNNLMTKHSIDAKEFNRYQKDFGPKQLIRASYATYKEKNGYSKFQKIAIQFKSMTTNSNNLNFTDLYSKVYVICINKVGIKIFYRIQYIAYLISNLYVFTKYNVKRLINSF